WSGEAGRAAPVPRTGRTRPRGGTGSAAGSSRGGSSGTPLRPATPPRNAVATRNLRLLHPRPGTAVAADPQHAALHRQAVAVQLHLGIVGLVAVGRIDLAVVVEAVAIGHHVPDDLAADVRAFDLLAR